MPTIEVSWIAGGHPYIDPDIEALTGYTAHEVRAMESDFITALVAPSHIPHISGLLDGGPPDTVVPKILPLVLCHKSGYRVCCDATLICRYGGNGKLTELWAALRQFPRQCEFCEFEDFWRNAPDTIRQLLHDSLALFPTLT